MATATAPAEERVIWEPHPGSQALFLTCPIWECLYTGTRGPGKTDALLMDFAQHVGEGWGADWRGVLFRQSYPQLKDVIAKTRKWFPRIFPEARFNKQSTTWEWPTGEELLFRHMKVPSDYNLYHGHEYPWIGWEELTNWPSGDCYHVMKSTNRSSRPGIPRKYRATCNPYGSGHNWVKAYFIDPSPAGVPFTAERSDVSAMAAEFGVEVDTTGLETVVLHGHYSENFRLMEAQPDYPAVIAASARNPEQAKAWLLDDWDVVAGGMFDDLWRKDRHILPPFEIPEGWTVSRAFDWGSSKPFSLGWWARANGEAVSLPGGRAFCPPPGSLIRVAEWYGWDGKTPNVGIRMTARQIAERAAEREREFGFYVEPGPGDFPTPAPGEESMRETFSAAGVEFTEPDKASGSRENGWQQMRSMLEESGKDHPEGPGLWVVETCRQWLRTVPVVPRSDRNPDDIDTDSEDHGADETRYMVTAKEAPSAVWTHYRI